MTTKYYPFFFKAIFCWLSMTGLAFATVKNTTPPPDMAKIAAKLGWIITPENTASLCGGYYQEPYLGKIAAPNSSPNAQLITISADQSEIHQTGISFLKGKVLVSQPERLAHADRAHVSRDTSGQFNAAELYGNVRLREPGKLLLGEQAQINFLDKSEEILQALYRISLERQTVTDKINSHSEPVRVTGLNAWGKASEIKRKRTGVIELSNTTYTTCPPTRNSWQLNADMINLNHDTGRGYARNSTLYLSHVPVLYWPYFNFPIDDRRQSGLLFPSYSSSNNSGLNINVPYYWNIAPNYDATITPSFYSERGLQLNGLFRYLTTSSNGNFTFGLLPHDAAFKKFREDASAIYANSANAPSLHALANTSNNRSYYSWQDNRQYNAHWSSNVDYASVSDDYYYEDFNNGPAVTASNQLLRQAAVNYADEHWDFFGLARSFQTLHPINQGTVSNSYNSLPELNLNGHFPNEKFGLNYQLPTQFVHFERGQNPGEIIKAESANRLHIQPGVSLPLTWIAGYSIPSLQFAATDYSIQNQLDGFSSHITRTLPIFNIDNGLFFDRKVSFGKNEFQQTLEPRLFYLYVPYRRQNDIPVFDSGSIPFNFDQLFSINRFSGLDRIGDANQISLAVTTRFLDEETGQEKFHASIGQIYYFRDRKVMLCRTNNCTDTEVGVVGSTSPTYKTSPIAGQLGYNFNPYWSAIANIAWDNTVKQTNNGNFAFQYKTAPDRIINFGYNFLRYGDIYPNAPAYSAKNNLNQATVSTVWPFKQHWRGVASLNLNISHDYPQTYFYGIEYNNCCWAVRLVSGRTFASLNQNGNPVFNNSIYLQWQLKGLGNLSSSDPTSLLTNSIPGYSDSFGKM